LPFGEFPAEVVVGMNQLDSLLHGWDLCAALGLPTSFPDDLVDRATQTALITVPPSRGYAFGPEVATDDAAGIARLAAFSGRDPSAWTGAIWVGGSLINVATTIGDGRVASAVEIWEREASGPPKHVHAEHDEIWYVLQGRFRFALGDREFIACAGDLVVGPRGVPHSFCAETADARVLDIHLPGGFENFFVKAGAPAAALTPPPPAPDAATPQLRATIEEFGAQVVGPPLRQ
jgi:quercetin dioxygenase-like cupin family protein